MSEELKREDFELGSGLADDFDGTIVDVKMGDAPAQYIEKASVTGGEVPPWIYLTIKPADGEEVGAEEITQGYGTGAAKGWKVTEDGKGLVSEKKSDLRSFNRNCRAGQLVEAMMVAAGSGDLQVGIDFFAARKMPMTSADFYKGLTFHWNRITKSTKIKEVTQSSDVLLPTAFIGLEASADGKSKGKATSGSKDYAISDADLASLSKVVVGKDEAGLKKALLGDKDMSKNKELMNQIFNKGLVAKLVKEGKLTVGPDGKFY